MDKSRGANYRTDNEKINEYLNVIEIMSKNTDAYMFLYDIRNGENWFFGDIDKEYAMHYNGKPTNTVAEMVDVVHPADFAALKQDLKLIASGKKNVHNMEYRWINRKGEVVWVSSRGNVINDEDGNPFVMIGRISDIVLKHLYNPLTSLFNKTKMLKDFKRKNLSESNCLMLVDIDNLSDINIKHGRKYGDELLRFLVYVMEKYIPTQRIYHVELDRFALILNIDSRFEAEKIFKSIKKDVAEKFTVSAGVVPFDKGMFIDESTIYEYARKTLLKAKAKGVANIAFYNQDELVKQMSDIELLEELEESIRNNYDGFYLEYQSQIAAGNYELLGAEALLRYRSDKRGNVYPHEFIPLLEKTELIKNVGMWVLENALLQCKKWRNTLPDFHISVNFSAVQFRDEYIAEKIIEKLYKTGMPGEALTVEITESVKLQEIEHFEETMKHLKSEGIKISIDDFGTGYSNMGYLKRFYADELKIDRIFVSAVHENTCNYNLICNIIALAKANPLRVCCEGVEDVKELVALESYEPDFYQGYLFSKPCTADIFEKNYINTETDEYKDYSRFIRKLYEYKEERGFIHFDADEILKDTELGLWIIRMNKDFSCCEMYADDTMKKILAVDKKALPEECYEHWHSRIKCEYADYVDSKVQRMIEIDNVVQLEYIWSHPTLGDVMVRCSGKRSECNNGTIVLHGYHKIINNIL